MTTLPSSRFDSANGAKRLQALYGVRSLDGFGHFSRAELAAGGALIDYVALTQEGQMPRIAPPKRLADGAVLEIDAATRRNLELSQTMTGERKGSLLSVIDKTRTGAGARLLQAHLAAPLTEAADIEARLDAVQLFHDQTTQSGQNNYAGRHPLLQSRRPNNNQSAYRTPTSYKIPEFH